MPREMTKTEIREFSVAPQAASRGPERLQAWFDRCRKVSGLPCPMSTVVFDWFDPDNRWDDEQLLAALTASIQARQAVPPEFIDIGKNAFAWHNIDAELAQLTCDPTDDRDGVPGMAAQSASISALTITSAHLTFELEVSGDSLLGQIIPALAGTIEVQTRAGIIATIRVGDAGSFSIKPIPASPFRLHGRTADGSDVLTGWILV